MTMSTPAALWFNACFTEPARAAINIPCSCTCSMTSSGGVPSALATSATLSWRRMTSTSGAAVAAVQPSSSRSGPALDLGHAVVGQDLLGEGAVLVGDHRPELFFELDRVQLAHALVLAGDDDVDAVGTVAHVLVEPGQLDLELLGAEADRAQDAEAAGVADGGGDVTAVREGEDRELDTEAFAQFVVHGVSS